MSRDIEPSLRALALGRPSGLTRIRRGLAKIELLGVLVGADRIGIHYRSVGRLLAVEMLTFNTARLVTHGAATCGDPA